FKTHRPAQALKPSLHGIQKQRWAAIVQIDSQRGVVTAGILIEQPPYIRLGHGRLSRTGAEPLQLQPRAVIVSRVGAACRTERRHCAVAIAEPLADGAKREPAVAKPGAASTVCIKTSTAATKSPRAASSTAAL